MSGSFIRPTSSNSSVWWMARSPGCVTGASTPRPSTPTAPSSRPSSGCGDRRSAGAHLLQLDPGRRAHHSAELQLHRRLVAPQCRLTPRRVTARQPRTLARAPWKPTCRRRPKPCCGPMISAWIACGQPVNWHCPTGRWEPVLSATSSGITCTINRCRPPSTTSILSIWTVLISLDCRRPNTKPGSPPGCRASSGRCATRPACMCASWCPLHQLALGPQPLGGGAHLHRGPAAGRRFIRVAGPYGFAPNWSLQVDPNPRCRQERRVFTERVKAKGWQRLWPDLVVNWP